MSMRGAAVTTGPGRAVHLAGGLHWLPIVWAVGWTTVLGVAFFTLPWPYVDIVNVLRDATTWAWPEYVRNAFFRDVEYRPLFTLSVKLLYQVVGLRLWWYQALVLAQFAAALALLVWLFRPAGLRRGVAASIAISCVVGLHTTRIMFGFWPVNHHSGGLVLLLLAIALALEPRARTFDWLFFPLTLAALLLLESGLLIAPVLAILWWFKAPGLSVRGVASTWVGVVTYLTIRFTLGTIGEPPSIYTGSGLGFSDLNPERLSNIFEHAPWLFWIYNVWATLMTVLVSEPRAGVYRFVASLLRGDTAAWQWFHVGSSVLTTAVVTVALVAFRPRSDRDRLLLVAGLALIVCGSALGFLYTRDRIALSAGVGYSVLVYVALVALIEHRPSSESSRALALCCVGILAAAWTIRSVETYFQLRDAAWDFHLEWTDRFADLAGTQPQTELVRSLRAAVVSSTPDDPRRDPPWSYTLLERRFTPGGGVSRGTPDASADTVVRPPSTPFDIRWKPDVNDAVRQRLEADLGLDNPERVERDPSGRTWTYRLRQPTRERVRAVVLHAAVEDTARIDTVRFEIRD